MTKDTDETARKIQLVSVGHQTITLPTIGPQMGLEFQLEGQPLQGDCCLLLKRIAEVEE